MVSIEELLEKEPTANVKIKINEELKKVGDTNEDWFR